MKREAKSGNGPSLAWRLAVEAYVVGMIVLLVAPAARSNAIGLVAFGALAAFFAFVGLFLLATTTPGMKENRPIKTLLGLQAALFIAFLGWSFAPRNGLEQAILFIIVLLLVAIPVAGWRAGQSLSKAV